MSRTQTTSSAATSEVRRCASNRRLGRAGRSWGSTRPACGCRGLANMGWGLGCKSETSCYQGFGMNLSMLGWAIRDKSLRLHGFDPRHVPRRDSGDAPRLRGVATPPLTPTLAGTDISRAFAVVVCVFSIILNHKILPKYGMHIAMLTLLITVW